jgi:DNA-binding transcriptional regulator GbsR (MarR family)
MARPAERAMTSRRHEALGEFPRSPRGAFQAAKEGWLKLCASYPNLSGADLAVVIFLSTYMNSKTLNAWPSHETLAKDTNRSRSTVWRSLEKLEKLNLVAVIHGRGPKNANKYRIALGAINAEPQTLRRKTTPRGKMLRTRNEKTANSQQNGCEFAAKTLKNLRRSAEDWTPERKHSQTAVILSSLS